MRRKAAHWKTVEWPWSPIVIIIFQASFAKVALSRTKVALSRQKLLKVTMIISQANYAKVAAT